MRLISAESFFRPPHDLKAPIEDMALINARTGIFGVVDGASEAYSPSHPPRVYHTGCSGGECTGGQAAANAIAINVAACISMDLDKFLVGANEFILTLHKAAGKNPLAGDDVAGLSFALCKLSEDGIGFRLGGDCFALVETEEGFSIFSNFDEAAFRVEIKHQELFSRRLHEAQGNRAKAWDAYWPDYRAKRLWTANKSIGIGGYADLNGDPAVQHCWTVERVEWTAKPRFVLLGTDGLLPQLKTDPRYRQTFAQELGEIFLHGGVQAVLDWRDRTEDSLTHITGWPEATAVTLKFV